MLIIYVHNIGDLDSKCNNHDECFININNTYCYKERCICRTQYKNIDGLCIPSK